MPSKVFGPTDSVADTLTQVGSTYALPPTENNRPVSKWFIYKLTVGKGNVVNAAQACGHIVLETTERSYHFAYGNGSGGATNNGQNGPAEPIECAIPAAPNSNIKVYVLDATVAKDVTVSVSFAATDFCIIGKLKAQPSTFKTLAAGGVSANGNTAADTEESFTVSSKLTKATLQAEATGRIYQIRIAGTGVVDAKAGSGLIKVNVPGVAGPYEYAFGNGPGGATLGGPQWADVIDIPEGIPVTVNSTVDVKITTAEIMLSPMISLSYW